MIWGGMTHQSVSVSLADAQFAEAAKITMLRGAKIFGMPPAMLDHEIDRVPDATERRYRELFLQPRLTMIEQALHGDPDLFPDKQLFPQITTAALLRPSVKDRADGYRLFRQGGVLTANELRALEDYPPHADGDELQMTPVGGAPNNPTVPGGNASDQ